MKLVLFQTAANAEILPGGADFRARCRRYLGGGEEKATRRSSPCKASSTVSTADCGQGWRNWRKAVRWAVALDRVRLRPPLPRPGKILACIANYWEHAQMRSARQLNMFMKNPDAVIGPGDTIVLPEFTVPWMFMHEAELALVMNGPAKMVKAKDWQSAVFGYTCMVDVSAREQGRRTWPATPLTSWLGKSFDGRLRRSGPASRPPTQGSRTQTT